MENKNRPPKRRGWWHHEKRARLCTEKKRGSFLERTQTQCKKERKEERMENLSDKIHWDQGEATKLDEVTNTIVCTPTMSLFFPFAVPLNVHVSNRAWEKDGVIHWDRTQVNLLKKSTATALSRNKSWEWKKRRHHRPCICGMGWHVHSHPSLKKSFIKGQKIEKEKKRKHPDLYGANWS